MNPLLKYLCILVFLINSCNSQNIPSRIIISEEYPFKYIKNKSLLILKEENRLFKYADSLIFLGSFDIQYTIEEIHETKDYYICPVGQEERYEHTYVYDKKFCLSDVCKNLQIVSVIDFEKNIILAYRDTMILNTNYFFEYYLFDLSKKDTIFIFPKNSEVLLSDRIYTFGFENKSLIIQRYNNDFQTDSTIKLPFNNPDISILYFSEDKYLVKDGNEYSLYNSKNKMLVKSEFNGIEIKHQFDRFNRHFYIYQWLKNDSIYILTESTIF